jgi:poly(A) polymerase Pap1
MYSRSSELGSGRHLFCVPGPCSLFHVQTLLVISLLTNACSSKLRQYFLTLLTLWKWPSQPAISLYNEYMDGLGKLRVSLGT